MKKYFDLVNIDNSHIKYEIINFPDGQRNLKILDVMGIESIDSIIIISRLNNFNDLELILCATTALRNVGYKYIELEIGYMVGGRSDRKFEEGGVNYLRDIIAPIINQQKYDKVHVLDPHSIAMENVINNLVVTPQSTFIKAALTHINNKNDTRERVVAVAPDGGAIHRVYDIARDFELRMITAEKHRDIKTGKILRTNVHDLVLCNYSSQFVIFDDICDGGRTFIEISKVIKTFFPEAEVYLVVTHGIFSNGLRELNEYFDHIYTTNSYREQTDTMTSEFAMHNENYLDLLTEFKIL